MRKRLKTATEAEALHRHESLPQEEELSREETIRRLRLLGQAITLFGEAKHPFCQRSPHLSQHLHISRGPFDTCISMALSPAVYPTMAATQAAQVGHWGR